LTFDMLSRLTGIGTESLRLYTKPSARRPPPPWLLKYLGWLGDREIDLMDARSTPLSTRLRFGQFDTALEQGLRGNREFVEELADRINAVSPHPLATVSLARYFMSSSTSLALARVLAQFRLTDSIAYEWRGDGGWAIGFFSISDGAVTIELLQDFVWLGGGWVDRPPIVFRLNPSVLRDATDATAPDLLLECLTVDDSLPDECSPRLGYALAVSYASTVIAIAVAHVIRTGAGLLGAELEKHDE